MMTFTERLRNLDFIIGNFIKHLLIILPYLTTNDTKKNYTIIIHILTAFRQIIRDYLQHISNGKQKFEDPDIAFIYRHLNQARGLNFKNNLRIKGDPTPRIFIEIGPIEGSTLTPIDIDVFYTNHESKVYEFLIRMITSYSPNTTSNSSEKAFLQLVTTIMRLALYQITRNHNELPKLIQDLNDIFDTTELNIFASN